MTEAWFAGESSWTLGRDEREEARAGTLYIVATPIGNLADITLRGLRILQTVDLVAAEDTRHTGRLLQAYGIKKPLLSCFAHNEQKQSQRITGLLLEGKSVALVSDAGMPGISDPGERLIREAIGLGLPVTVLPGANAALTALVASGLALTSFAFGGFFPRENKDRRTWLRCFGDFPGTVIFYESPHRLKNTLLLLESHWGQRNCCVARELTKHYEEFLRGTLAQICRSLEERGGEIKGEIVVLVAGASSAQQGEQLSPAEVVAAGKALVAQGMKKKEAGKLLAEESGWPAKEIYRWLIEDTESSQE